mmetsp:Transcript_4598/g.13419  ORF Transcript_4598/g.13419 Transcript_4598/m.13419 type:complete len:229 (+) Transcript_4598:1941-2627(+)
MTRLFLALSTRNSIESDPVPVCDEPVVSMYILPPRFWLTTWPGRIRASPILGICGSWLATPTSDSRLGLRRHWMKFLRGTARTRCTTFSKNRPSLCCCTTGIHRFTGVNSRFFHSYGFAQRPWIHRPLLRKRNMDIHRPAHASHFACVSSMENASHLRWSPEPNQRMQHMCVPEPDCFQAKPGNSHSDAVKAKGHHLPPNCSQAVVLKLSDLPSLGNEPLPLKNTTQP